MSKLSIFEHIRILQVLQVPIEQDIMNFFPQGCQAKQSFRLFLLLEPYVQSSPVSYLETDTLRIHHTVGEKVKTSKLDRS